MDKFAEIIETETLMEVSRRRLANAQAPATLHAVRSMLAWSEAKFRAQIANLTLDELMKFAAYRHERRSAKVVAPAASP